MTRKIAAFTIGQSPRMDVVPEMLDVLGPDVQILEAGALDGLSAEEVAELRPRAGDYVLVTRMRDGSSVQIAEHHILPRMQGQIDRLVEEGAEVVALLCTGEFPGFTCSRLLLEPQRLLHHFVAGVGRGRRVGAVVPAPEQIEQGTRRWREVANEVQVEAATPYGDVVELERATRRLKDGGAELIVLDCIGFTGAMKRLTTELAGVPVVLPRTVLARTIGELLGS
jgi:protein AroM